MSLKNVDCYKKLGTFAAGINITNEGQLMYIIFTYYNNLELLCSLKQN